MKHTFTILFVLIISSSYSQNCSNSIIGKIIDFHNNQPLENATIKLIDGNENTISDITGKFVFNNLCNNSYTLEVSHLGCETITITVSTNNNKVQKIFLEHHLEELNEVKVSGTKKIEATSIQKSLSKKDIEKFSDKSLGDALNTISGVSSLNTGNTIVKPMIHGLHSSRLLIVNNNVRQFDQEWGEEHAPNIDINSGGRLEVVKGANTLIYGSDAIGGVILIRPQNYAVKDSLFGSASASLNTNGWGGNVNSEIVKTYKNGFYTRVQGSYKLFGDFETPDYILSNTGVRSRNVSARIGYKSFDKGFDAYYSYVNNSLGILRSAHVGNANDLFRAIQSDRPLFIDDFTHNIDNPRQKVIHYLGKVEAYKRFRNLGKLTAQYDFQVNRRKEFDIRRGSLRNRPAINLKLFTTSFQPNLKIDAFDNLKINTGLLLRYQENTPISGTGISIPLIPEFK